MKNRQELGGRGEVLTDDKAKLLTSIKHALGLIGEQELHPHTSFVVAQMLKALRPSDLTDCEMMAVAIVLAHAHARKLGRPRPTKVKPISDNADQLLRSG